MGGGAGSIDGQGEGEMGSIVGGQGEGSGGGANIGAGSSREGIEPNSSSNSSKFLPTILEYFISYNRMNFHVTFKNENSVFAPLRMLDYLEIFTVRSKIVFRKMK